MTAFLSVPFIVQYESRNNQVHFSGCKNNHFCAIKQKNCSKIWNFQKIFLSMHPENGPLQLKGYVDVAHSCRLYGAVSVL